MMSLVHFKGPYQLLTACGRTSKQTPGSQTTRRAADVTCGQCLSAIRRHREAEKDMGDYAIKDDMYGVAKVHRQHDESRVRVTVGRLREAVQSILKETTIYTRNDDNVMVPWMGDRDRISRALARMGVNQAARDAILAGKVPLTMAVANTLRKQGVIKRDVPPRQPKPYDWEKEDRRRLRGNQAFEKAYRRAIKDFCAHFTSFAEESPDSNPEDAASDLAENFFLDYPEWRDWARALGMSRADMKEAITDYVYDAMMKGRG